MRSSKFNACESLELSGDVEVVVLEPNRLMRKADGLVAKRGSYFVATRRNVNTNYASDRSIDVT